MGDFDRINDLELRAYFDGALDPVRHAEIDQALAADPALACRAEEVHAERRRAAAARSTRIAQDDALRPAGATAWLMATAAAVLLIMAAGSIALLHRPADTILAEAAAAHAGQTHPDLALAGPTLTPEAARALLAGLGLSVKTPDLSRFGYRLAALDSVRHRAAVLTYRTAQGAELTIYVRRSTDEPRMVMVRQGGLQVCLWQDGALGAVITGGLDLREAVYVVEGLLF